MADAEQVVRVKLLDLFCGAGGAAMGYSRAGFDVVGVDINAQPHYPFEFHQADAMTFPLDGYDAIHASPPCQAYSVASRCVPGLADTCPDLIAPMRERLATVTVPWVIENVVGAPLINPLMLCGNMFGLRLFRHRLFESNVPLPLALHPPHGVLGTQAGKWKPGRIISVAGNCAPIAEARRAMGIDWMNRGELSQAIPPAYTRWIGEHLMAEVTERAGRA